MRKFTKVVLIITAVFVVTGMGFIIAGSVTAGGMGVLRQQLKSGELNFGNWHFEDGVYYKGGIEVDMTDAVTDAMQLLPVGTEKDKSEFAETISAIEIDTDLANITVKATDTNQVKVNLEDGYKKYFEAKVKGDTLYVSYDVKGKSFKQGPKITVELPREMCPDKMHVDTDLGEVRLLGIRQLGNEWKIKSALGNIVVGECEVNGKCTITASLGNIHIEDSSFGEIDLNAAMGNIEFSGEVNGDLLANAAMGNIEVEVDGREEDYNIELSTDMGDVKYKGQSHEGMGGSYKCYPENPIGDIVLDCDMGNVELEFE